MRHFIFPALLGLTACSTPQERCVGSISRDQRVIGGLINETQGNIARGFAIREVQELITVDTTCDGVNAEGVEFTVECEEVETVTREEAVAIDLNAERAKLASLQERLAELRANQSARIAQCQAQFPNG